MILTKSILNERAQRRDINSASENRILNEAQEYFNKRGKTRYDLFLSHSSLDKKIILALVDMFKDAGIYVYVDWIDDPNLDRNNVTPATANKLKTRMMSCRGLSYITTQNSLSSKWCPWELGYFDGLKDNKCNILPILDISSNHFDGQEYLGLYPYLSYEIVSNTTVFFVCRSSTAKILLNDWLNGKPI